MAALKKRTLLVLVLVLVGSWVAVEQYTGSDRNTYSVGDSPEVTAVETLPDGGYLVGGHVRTGDGDSDAVVLRLDANRSLESVHRFGGDGDEELSDLTRTRDGGFAFVGWRGEYDTSVGWIVTVDGDGEVVSNRQFGPANQDVDRVNAVIETDNGTIAAVGRTSRGVTNGTGAVLYELNANGDVLLERVYETEKNRSATAIVQASSGGYLIGGTDGHHPIVPQYKTDETPSAWLARVAATGELLWTQQTRRAVTRDIVHAHDNGYVVAVVGATTGTLGRGMSLQRFDPRGDVVWTRDAEYTCSSEGNPLARSPDGYVLVRETCSDDSPAKADAVIERWTTEGNLAWNRTFDDDIGLGFSAVTTHEDGTYVAAGTVDERIWLQTVTASERVNGDNATTTGDT